jgi:hypothetical protein
MAYFGLISGNGFTETHDTGVTEIKRKNKKPASRTSGKATLANLLTDHP